MSIKTVLLLDDACESQNIEQMFLEAGIHCSVARCVDDAVTLLKEMSSQGIHGLVIVDLVVPISKEDLNAVDAINAQRHRVLSQIAEHYEDKIDSENIDPSLQDLEKNLCDFNWELESLINTEGGLLFLRKSQRTLKNWGIMILSARNINHVCSKLPPGTSLHAAIEKPVSLKKLMEVVMDFWKK